MSVISEVLRGSLPVGNADGDMNVRKEMDKIQIEEVLKAGNTVQIKPQGYSMYPVFVPGRDEAVIAPFSEGTLRRGNVALYRRDGSILVLHRVCRVARDGYYFVGDNQKEIEGPIRPDQVRGVMTAVVRKGKRISVTRADYRILTGFWLWLRPVRPVISKTVAGLKRMLKRK